MYSPRRLDVAASLQSFAVLTAAATAPGLHAFPAYAGNLLVSASCRLLKGVYCGDEHSRPVAHHPAYKPFIMG